MSLSNKPQHDEDLFTSEAVTDGIRVAVRSMFDRGRSKPESGQWFFLYTVTITNESATTVRLLSRYWLIKDEAGGAEEVRGPGVVGEQPILEPGTSFEYTSGCPLTTATGTMEGSYQMEVDGGDPLEVQIAPFLLSEPFMVN